MDDGMAVIFDFPTNYEEKLRQADELLEKGYVDQAICLLEDFIEQAHPVEGLSALKKMILTCYFIKKEFETCDELLKEWLIGSQDLTLWAHDLLLTRYQAGEEALITLQQQYEERLSTNRFVYKNLVELTMQLKNFYETYWFEQNQKRVMNFLNGESFEQQVLTISDLQHLSKEELECFKDQIEEVFLHRLSPVIKTLLFELLVQKGVNWTLRFEDHGEVVELKTAIEELHPLYEVLDQISKLIETQAENDVIKELLTQQALMFYQYCFPFYNRLEASAVVAGLRTFLLEGKTTFLTEDDYKSTNKTIIDYTCCKLSQYLLSLSSLM